MLPYYLGTSDQKKLILYRYLNQHYTKHEYHCIGASMNKMHDFTIWSLTSQQLCYHGSSNILYHNSLVTCL